MTWTEQVYTLFLHVLTLSTTVLIGRHKSGCKNQKMGDMYGEQGKHYN